MFRWFLFTSSESGTNALVPMLQVYLTTIPLYDERGPSERLTPAITTFQRMVAVFSHFSNKDVAATVQVMSVFFV